MNTLSAFQEHVGMKYQIYNGLFLNLPFPDVQSSGILLPVFTSYCHDALEEGRSPIELVEEFFSQRVGTESFRELKNDLFRFLRLTERQVVLFDAMEDSAFTRIVDTQGPGSIKDTLNRVERSEIVDDYQKLLDEYRVRIVLTAHPTQFYTDQVLSILVDLVESLQKNDLQEINNLLLQMGNTRFKKQKKPTPLDEAQSLMWTLENVMYSVIPKLHAHLVEDICPDEDAALNLPAIIELGFWPGGDRDGNPFVNHEITTEVGQMLRRKVIGSYLEDARDLTRRLTFDGVLERIERVVEKLDSTLNPVGRYLNVQKLYEAKQVEGKVFHVEVSDEGYNSADELLEELFEIRNLIIREHNGLFVQLLNRFIYKIQCFGFHFASLDIRQDSAVHTTLCSNIIEGLDTGRWGKLHELETRMLNGQGYEEAEEEQRIEALLQAAKSIAKLDHLGRQQLMEEILDSRSDAISRDCLLSFKAIHEIQSRNGEKGAHRYVISHTERSSHVLEVWFLSLLSGFDPDILPLDIVPLFETVEDLHNAPGIMNSLYEIPEYSGHLENRSRHQHIMLGFSDGTKDGGYVTANWEIYKAKETLTQTTGDHGFRVLFFDGRGGPPARGGGNTHKFYRGLGSKIDSKTIQLTIQGQTISSSYGTEDIASHNLGQLVSAGLENNLFPSDIMYLNEEERNLIERLSERANAHYMALRNHPKFLPYLEHMTPLSYYGRTNIGSRPSKRSKEGPLNLDSLRAIPFVGAWSQMKQNIPGYYGLGTALEELIKQGEKEKLQKLYHNSLFFRTLMENSMQSLSKSYFPLTSYLNEDPEYGEFWNILKSEAELSTRNLFAITGQNSLLDTDQVIRESIKMRERLILPVIVIQQYALQKIRQLQEDAGSDTARFMEGDRDKQKDVLEKLIIKSLMASINASRNSV